MIAYRYVVAAWTLVAVLLLSFDSPPVAARVAAQTGTAGTMEAVGTTTPDGTAIAGTSECTAPLDVLIIMDVSQSMGLQLELAKQRSGEIMTALREQVPDSQFGVASVVDYPTLIFGSDYPWHLDQPITSDIDAVQQALQTITLHSGGDLPESYGRALYEAQDPWRIGWRFQSRHMVIFWGDDVAHDPDPGPDGQLATGDDLSFSDVLKTTAEYGIHVYSISFGREEDFQRMATETEGQFYRAQDANELPVLITRAVQQACTSIVPPSLGQIMLRLTTIRGTVNLWCFTPLLLLLPPLLLLWQRRATRRAIRSGMPLPALGQAPHVAALVPPAPPRRPPIRTGPPAAVSYRPALVVGLGSAGRWTLTYLKQALGHQDQVTLLAVDLAADTPGRAVPPVTLIEPDVQLGSSTVTLDSHELCWLRGNPDALAEDIRRRPDTYPLLHDWLGMVDERAAQVSARLTLLADLPGVMARLEQALADLGGRHGVDVYIVAGLGEAVGAGVSLDIAQSLHVAAVRGGQALALHGVLYLPDTLDTVMPPDQAMRADTFTVWRALDRMQTHFGQQPPGPLAFDAVLLNGHSTPPTIDSKLLSTCALISADRQVGSLISTSPEAGVYPQTADALSALLEQPAAERLEEHRSNINSRLSQAQPNVDRGLYSSFGTFTYRLQPTALIQELADRLLVQSVDGMLMSGAPAPMQPLFSEMLVAAGYDLFRQVASQTPPRQWETETILGLLEPPTSRGQLAVYMQDALPRHARFELLRTGARGGSAIQRISEAYDVQYLGSATLPGQWSQQLTANAAVARTIFRDNLLRELAALLNTTDETGHLARAQALVAAVAQRLTDVKSSLAPSIAAHDRALVDLRSAATVAVEVLQTSKPSPLRRLLGHVTSLAEDRVLDQQQERLACELERLAAQTAVGLLAEMQLIAQQQQHSLQLISEQLGHECQRAQQRLDSARARRLAQLDLARVRHEWGMPHADLSRLREFIDPQRTPPSAERDRRHVQVLRDYIAGEHISRLCEQHPVSKTALVEHIFWTWDSSDPQANVQPVVIDAWTVQRPMETHALCELAAALYSWVWELRLPDLLAVELDHPATLAHQLSDERASPSIRYVPTPHDQHEVHTFLLVPPAAEAAHSRWFEQVVSAQRETGSQMISHQLLKGGDPYRVTYLSTYELIGALQPGALPAYDDLAHTYQLQARRRNPVVPNEALAAHFEQQRQIIRKQLHPQLVDALYSRQRAELFARALLSGVVQLDARVIPPRYVTRLNGDGPAPLGPPVSNGASPALRAFRWFTLCADAQLLRSIEQAVGQALPGIDQATYDQWLMAGLPAQLRASKDPAEQDLADLLQVILDPTFDS